MFIATPHDLGRGHATRSPIYALNGMVACAHPLAAEAGVAILKRGGSAVDAAIAVNACLCVMEPTACGLGGDLFAIVWDPETRRPIGLNGSGRAPLGIRPETVDVAADGSIPEFSPFTWTVPGCVDAWAELHGRFGRLTPSEVLEPAIDYAEAGCPVPPVVAQLWARGAELHGNRPGFAETFLSGGRPPTAGEVFRNKALGHTLRELAQSSWREFYEGRVAAALVRFSSENGGLFSLSDLRTHRSSWDAPVSSTYRGTTLWEMPPNSQGIAALQLLNILEEFDLRGIPWDHPDFWHICVEAKKLAWADRAAHYADPEFSHPPIDHLLSKEYARERATLIDMNRAAPGYEAVTPMNRSETTYLCTADRSGMMVSLIQSNYLGFGSGYAVPELGFGLQNRGALFSLDPTHPNGLTPGKRPFHTIIPALATRGLDPFLVFGVMGGDMQPQGHAQIMVNLLDFDMNIQEAGDAIRWHHVGPREPTGTELADGGRLYIEAGLPHATLAELERRGHRLDQHSTAQYGGYQAIAWDAVKGTYAGATEMRKDGLALGF